MIAMLRRSWRTAMGRPRVEGAPVSRALPNAQLASSGRVDSGVTRRVVAVMVLLAPGAAPARAEWSEPERVSPPSIVSDPFLGYTRDGRPVAAWHVRRPYGTHNPGSVRVGARRSRGRRL